MRILFIGDVVGSPGVAMVRQWVPEFRRQEKIDFVIANAENASGGSGLYPNTYRQLRKASIDAFTMGDHIYKKVDITAILEADEPIVKPANYPASAPGADVVIRPTETGTLVAVISLIGRTYMRPVDCPFQAVDRVLNELPKNIKVIVVDIHAEATADKYLILHHLKGRVSAVLGTHTHVPTADERVFDPGTAFICDVGMTGPYDSILGRRIDRVLSFNLDFVPTSFDVATDDPRLAGVIVDIDESTGRAYGIRRVMLYGTPKGGDDTQGLDRFESLNATQ